MRAGWGGGSAAAAGKTSGGEKKAAKAPSAAQTARSIETGGGDDDVDSLFGDDEEEDGGGGGGPSRAEQMAAAKAEKDKKKKLDRSGFAVVVRPYFCSILCQAPHLFFRKLFSCWWLGRDGRAFLFFTCAEKFPLSWVPKVAFPCLPCLDETPAVKESTRTGVRQAESPCDEWRSEKSPAVTTVVASY